jgi:hypothetical protein
MNLKSSLSFPPNAKNITVEVVQANIWWSVVNIKEGVNDEFRLITDIEAGVGTTVNIVIPKGLYTLALLSDAIDRLLVVQGIPSGTVKLSADDSTQRTILSIANKNSVVFHANTPYELFGFNLDSEVEATQDGFSVLSPNIARFGDIDSFLIHSDIVNGGIPINGSMSQTLAQAPIDVLPGSLITFRPRNPIRLNCSHLRHQDRNTLSFWITDQKNKSVDTNGEFWSAMIVFRYLVPVEL